MRKLQILGVVGFFLGASVLLLFWVNRDRTDVVKARRLALAEIEKRLAHAGPDEPLPTIHWRKPKLAVILVFDQFRGDYLSRWEKHYGEGGFKRLMKDGAWFTNCHYPYSDTLTAPGHASLATGTTPSRHGIVANSWFNRQKGDMQESVESFKFRPVPKPPKDLPGSTPEHRRAETVGDVLLRVTKGKAKVASLSIKDRAAILLAAFRARICYWFSTAIGQFVSSTYYLDDDLAPWVKEFNKSKMPDQWAGKEWTRFKDDAALYDQEAGPDDLVGEGSGYAQGRVFPHPFPKKTGKEYYQAVTCAPQGNEMLLELAKRCIVAEKLGQGSETDLLCLSFSCNDVVGHSYGPDSHEVFDMTLRTDQLVRELLDYLDEKVGKDNYVLAMSADHGVCPLPEFSKEGGRIDPGELNSAAHAHMDSVLGGKRWMDSFDGRSWFTIHPGTCKAMKKSPEEAAETLAAFLRKQKGIQAAYTRTQMMEKSEASDPLLERVKLTFHPDNSGDVMFVMEPKWLPVPPVAMNPKGTAYSTTHGSPNDYDTWVPLVVMGPGVKAGKYDERIMPQALAPILSRAIGITPPRGNIAPLPEYVFKGE